MLNNNQKIKKLKISILNIFMVLFFFSCDTNRTLKQENAEKVIKEFVSSRRHGSGSLTKRDTFALSSIEPVNQFSGTEAYSMVHIQRNSVDEVDLQFFFQKGEDKKWILNSIKPVNGFSLRGLHDWMGIAKDQNINILVQ